LNALENVKSKEILRPGNKLNWPFISLLVPGRTGDQCKQHFKNLQLYYCKKIDYDDVRSSYEFKNNHISALSDSEELMLYDEISSVIDDGRIITREEIAQRAFEIYYSPVSMARKAAFLHFYKKGINVYNEDEEVIPEHIDEYNKKFQKYLIIATDQMNVVMNKFNIKNFKASMSWVSKFMKRYHLVFRKVHYQRRGAIDKKWADKFLIQVADAIAKYGVENVINMDETQVRIDNSSGTVIAHKGQEKVTIYRSHFNTKEGFTAIATCSQVKKFPLIVIAKGKPCKRKQKKKKQVDENSPVTHFKSKSGWTDVDIMKSYIDWLQIQMNNQPCALIIDCFRAHTNEEVKNYAKGKKIEIILVPACGTGIYQPLDRKIFGILKAKLRADESQKKLLQEEVEYKNRYKIIEEAMNAAWEEISEEAQISAWRMPGLSQMLPKKCEYEDKSDTDFIPSETADMIDE